MANSGYRSQRRLLTSMGLGLLLVLSCFSSHVVASEDAGSLAEDAIELHDDVPQGSNDQQEPADLESAMNGMTNDQKKQFLEMQQIRTVGSILFAQIFMNTNSKSLTELFSATEQKLQQGLFKKLVAQLILHCLSKAEDQDIVKIITNAKEGKFSIDDMIHLSTFDISEFNGVPAERLELSAQEQQAFKAYEDYERASKEEKERRRRESGSSKGSSDKDSTNQNSGNDKNKNGSFRKKGSLEFFGLDFSSLGIPLLICLAGLFGILFSRSRVRVTFSFEDFDRKSRSKHKRNQKERQSKVKVTPSVV